jgi:hypothetical protein
MSKEWATVAILVVFLLAILGFRSYISADKNIGADTYAVPDATEDGDGADPNDPIRRKVLEIRSAREAAAEKGEVTEDDEGWSTRKPTEVPVYDTDEFLKDEQEDEVAQNEFLPKLEEFTPLEPMAVRAMRTRLMDRVTFGGALTIRIHEGGAELPIQEAGDEGLKVQPPGGEATLVPWRDVSIPALYGAVKADLPNAKGDMPAEELIHLSQLADMAMQKEDASEFLTRALELKPELKEIAERGPVVELDKRILNEYSWPWDDPTDPEPANSLADDSPSILHAYRYMRTVGLEELQKGAIHNPQYAAILKRPAEFRGRTIRLEARYVKRFKSMRITKVAGYQEAGIRDIDFCFVVDAHVRGIYLVSAPQDLRQFGDSDIVTLTGVYIRRWPYIRHGVWKWVPWIAALSVEEFEVAPIKGWKTATYLLVTGAGIVFVVIAYFARRDSKEGVVARGKLTRMRTGRDHIRRKVAEAVASEKKDEDSAGEPKPGGEG